MIVPAFDVNVNRAVVWWFINSMENLTITHTPTFGFGIGSEDIAETNGSSLLVNCLQC